MLGQPRDSRLIGFARLVPLLIAGFEFRGLLAHLGHATFALNQLGHAYLHSPAPWIVTLVACGAALLLREAAHGLAGRMSRPRWSRPLVGLWLLASAGFLIAVCGRELVRDLLTTGHPAGLFSSAGWSSIPAAALVGFGLAASVRATRWLVTHVRRRPRPDAVSRRVVTSSWLSPPALAPAPAPLLDSWSGRGPPVSPALAVA